MLIWLIFPTHKKNNLRRNPIGNGAISVFNGRKPYTRIICVRTHRVMQENRVFMYVSGNANVDPPKYSSGANDAIFILVHELSFECYAILWTFEC